MRYDTTGPATANEVRSLLVMLGVVAAAASAAYLYYGNEVATPVVTGETAMPEWVPEGKIEEGVNRVREDLTAVKAGNTVVYIQQHDADIGIRRVAPRDDPEVFAQWEFARVAAAIGREPAVAKRYGAEGVAEKVRAISLRPPQLTVVQRDQLRELFLAMQDARGDAKSAAEQRLYDAVKGMAIPAGEWASFERSIEKAKALFTPEQLEMIRNGGRRKPVKTRPNPPLHPARSHPKPSRSASNVHSETPATGPAATMRAR